MSRLVVTSAFLLLAALCIQDTTAWSAADCKDFIAKEDSNGWQKVPLTDYRIKVFVEPKTFSEALEVCSSLSGSRLLEIVNDRFHNAAMCLLNAKYDNARVWLASKLVYDKYKWSFTGKGVADNWVKGQPDFTGGEERCLEMNWREMGKYNDDRCQRKKSFICSIGK